MKRLKKTTSLVCILALVASMLFSLLSCAFLSPDGAAEDKTTIRIGVMAGPTGMGMAKLMSDEAQSARYDFRVYSDPSVGVGDLTAENLDMLCLPTNTAANLYARSGAKVIAVNTLGTLYLLTSEDVTVRSLADLEGKTVYTSVPSSTTGPILRYLLDQAEVSAAIETVADHDALVAKVALGEVKIAVLPEPKVTAALLQNTAYKVALNLSEEWAALSESPLTMGCIVVRDAFLQAHRSLIDAFLGQYEASIGFINDPQNLESAAQMIVDADVLPKLAVAKKALSNLYGSIAYLDGTAMKTALERFYDAIGQTKPDGEFYYAK